jgi:FkbM family methyltransferase
MVPEIKMIIKNEYGQIIDHNIVEAREWHLVAHYVKEHHQILELGARYGSASIACNKIINDKSKQVSVEPDPTVWNILEENKKSNDCEFNIIKGAISKNKLKIYNHDYATYTEEGEGDIPVYDLWDLQNMFDVKFNAVVADCEGCLSELMNNYPELFTQIELLIYEMDQPELCDYNKLTDILNTNGFRCVESGFHNVYVKN